MARRDDSARTAAPPPSSPPRGLFLLALGLHAVCPLLFFTDLTRNPYVTQIALLNAGLCLAAAILAGAALYRGRLRFLHTPLDVPLLIFLGVGALSWGLSWRGHPPFRPSVLNEGGRVMFFWLVNCLAAYGLAVQLRSPERDRRWRSAALAVGAAAGIYGVLQYLGHEFIWSGTLNPYSGRPVSTFGNPNFLSSYLVMLLPVAAAEALSAKTAGRRALFAAVFLAYVAAVVCTFTRSSWIGAVVALAALGFSGRRWVRRRRGLAASTLLAAALLVALWPSSPLAGRAERPADRLIELVRGVTQDKPYGSWHQRLMIWSCAWDMVREHPVVGKGFGCFELFYPFYQGSYLSDRVFREFRTHANNAHNVVLEIWSQAGTSGLAVFVWIFALLLTLGWRRIPRLAEEEQLPAWALLSGVAGMLADNFFGNVSLFFAVPAFLFWWMTGTLSAALSPEGDRSHGARGWRGWSLALLTILFGLFGLQRSWRHWRAEVDYFEGFKRAKQGDAAGAVAALEKSRRARRPEVNNDYELGNAYARRARWSADNGLLQESARWAEKAVWAYGEALAANAGYDEVYFNRAAMEAQLGRPAEAERDYRLALLINPLSLEAYKALGNLYLSQGKDWARTADHFDRAVFYFPRDKDLWNNLGYAHTKSGRAEDAAEAYARAYRLDFNFDVAWRNLHVSLAGLGRKAHPVLGIPALWEDLRRAAVGGRWKEARRLAERIAEAAPENARARLALGEAQLQTEDVAAAEASLRQALEWEPGLRPARILLARVLLRRGARSEALELADALSREAPDDPDVRTLKTNL